MYPAAEITLKYPAHLLIRPHRSPRDPKTGSTIRDSFDRIQ